MRNDGLPAILSFFSLLFSLFAAIACGTTETVSLREDPRKVGSLSDLLPPMAEPSEGIVLRGSDPRMMAFRTFLRRAGIPATLGHDTDGSFVLSVPRDRLDRFLIVPYAWEHIDFGQRIAPLPEDDPLYAAVAGIPAEMELRIPDWEKRFAPALPAVESLITFGHGSLNLPFNEDTVTAFFYSLRDAIGRVGTLSALYHPAFSGLSVTVRVHLFSVDILFEEPAALSPEELFLWFYTLRETPERFDDDFHANLLSLKIAKKLYTGLPSFLGGSILFTRSGEVPFDELRRHLFSAEGVSLSGGVSLPYYYAYRGELFSETTVLVAPERTEPVRAFYGTPENAARSIVSIVLRAADAEKKRQLLEDALAARGITPFGRLYERSGDDDGWAALSVTVPVKEEAAFLKFFGTELAAIDKTISIGVYRVGTEEE